MTDLLDSSDSESRDNIRAKIQFKIKQQANLLSQLAFSLSDDILDTSLEKARAQENLESLQITSCESNSTSFR
ncbi:hypothetical protein C0J52_21388 [Blattella germanica]|nr:hypothetical protein C0J52_21388 [Blattella germanica]